MTSTDERVSNFADKFGLTLANTAQAALPPTLRELQRTILAAFVDTGAAPTSGWIADQARRLGLNPNQALAELDRADLVHTDATAVTVAYPFSGIPTRHQVQFDTTDGSRLGRLGDVRRRRARHPADDRASRGHHQHRPAHRRADPRPLARWRMDLGPEQHGCARRGHHRLRHRGRGQLPVRQLLHQPRTRPRTPAGQPRPDRRGLRPGQRHRDRSDHLRRAPRPRRAGGVRPGMAGGAEADAVREGDHRAGRADQARRAPRRARAAGRGHRPAGRTDSGAGTQGVHRPHRGWVDLLG